MIRRLVVVATAIACSLVADCWALDSPVQARGGAVSMVTSPNIKLGDHVVVTGDTRSDIRREVVLQRQAGNVWGTIARASTAASGKYRLVDRVASRVGTYRVRLPAVVRLNHRYPSAVSRTQVVAMQSGLKPGESLGAGEGIVSPNGSYRLVQQGDGNLVIYQGATALWASGTNGPDRWSVMQEDGNFVVYEGAKPSARAVWSSSTSGAAGSRLTLQDDGNLVIYSAGGVAHWSTKSGATGATQGSLTSNGAVNYLRAGQELRSPSREYRLVMQGDGNLVVYNKEGRATWSSKTAGNPGSYLQVQDDGNLVVYGLSAALEN